MTDIRYAESPSQKHGCGSGPRHTGNTHVQPCYQDEIQYNICCAGDSEQQKGRCAVAQSAQNTSIEVVPHVAQDSYRCNP